MQQLLIHAALALLARIRWDNVLALIWRLLGRKIPAPVLAHIDTLVRAADVMGGYSGAQKAQWVRDMVAHPAEDEALRELAAAVPAHLINAAVEQAVARLKAEQGED